MNEKSAKVTVILPVYNGEKYLSRAITSVLEQSIGQEEIKLYNYLIMMLLKRLYL